MQKVQSIRVPYALAVYGKEEKAAVARVLENPSKIVPGLSVREFEKKIAQLFGKKYGVMVNSGSSANLLALELLNLKKGSEVITPALTFSTTLTPILQKGLVPVFVDVVRDTYVIDIEKVERAITKKTRALMIPSLLGNLPDMARLKAIAKKHKLWFIEDSCDTLGPRFAGKPSGTFSDITTTSFYASHIITTAGAGGMICLNDPNLAKRALVMSSWGRASTLFGVHEKSEDIKRRFKGRIGGKVYDAKFIFTEVGYNFQPTELQAAFGLEQLKRLPLFTRKRAKNFNELKKFFDRYTDWFMLPKKHTKATINWLAFPILLTKDAPFSRADITEYLEEKNIQTRPIFTGNVLRQPAFQKLGKGGMANQYSESDYVMRNGFILGCHHGLTTEQMRHLKSSLQQFVGQFEL